MGRQLAEDFPVARALFDRANKVLDYDLAKLCFEGPAEQLNSTVHSQPALFVCSLAALEKLRAESPDVVDGCAATAGLSLGEYTALVFAGVMSFEDGLRVVQVRGRAMQDASNATPSGMVSVLGLEREQVAELCDQARGDDVLQMANFLCPGNIAVSGGREACQRAEQLAPEMGAMKAMPLTVAGAFHTTIMQSAIEKLADALANVEMQSPRIPVVLNVDATPHNDPEAIRGMLTRQVVEPVLWEDSMRYLLDEGADQFYEIGPGRVLRGLLLRIQRKTNCENVS
jgi:[acyl-carrier-protein] S-malonyltransferase